MNVLGLWLIHGVTVEDGTLHARVTVTSAACPVTGLILEEIENELDRDMPSELRIRVELV